MTVWELKLPCWTRITFAHTLNIPKLRPLPSEDSVKFILNLTQNYIPELIRMFISFNPDPEQKEQHIFNNFIYKNFVVESDNTSPVLDVTFDGVHILSRDIVSAKPHIKISLKMIRNITC